jgi:hypothetical protein
MLRVRAITERHPIQPHNSSTSHTTSSSSHSSSRSTSISHTWEQVLALEVVYHKLTHLA